MRGDDWQDVTRGDPCAICGKDDWCSISTDGQVRICRRTNNGTGKEYQDTNNAYFWLYRVDGEPIERPQTYDRLISQIPMRADAPTLDRVYLALLSHLQLAKSHRENLLARGLTPQEIDRRRYRTLPRAGQSPYRTAIANRLVEQFGPETCAQVPGLYVLATDAITRWSLGGTAGILLPVRDLDGRIVALKIRADVPHPDATSRYSYLSSTRHRGPGPGAQVHVPLHGAPHHTIRITEGELKADIATALSGILTLSVPGVGTWRIVVPVLDALKPTRILLAFDADWRDNPNVANALRDAIHGRQQTPYDLQIEQWSPTHGKGIDDVLAAHHSTHLLPPARALGALWPARARMSTFPTLNAKEVSSWPKL